jgi:gamma-glutamyltranspeptidase
MSTLFYHHSTAVNHSQGSGGRKRSDDEDDIEEEENDQDGVTDVDNHDSLIRRDFNYSTVPTTAFTDADITDNVPSSMKSPQHQRGCWSLWITLLIGVFLLVGAFVVLGYHQSNYHSICSRSGSNEDTTCDCARDGWIAATETTTANSLMMQELPQQQQQQQQRQKYYVRDHLEHGMVASDHAICSQQAVSIILQQYNGTAVDAAIFTALCLGVVNPASSGLGGGSFMLLYHNPSNPNNHSNSNTSPPSSSSKSKPEKVTEVIDCRERAPLAAHTAMYRHLPPNASVYGALAIPVMGELHCLHVAHSKFGTIPWSQIVQPVAQMANDGIVVGPYLAQQIHDAAIHHSKTQQSNPNYNQYHQYDSLRSLLTHDHDWSTPLRLGDTLRNVEMARTLQSIATLGLDALYGPLMATRMATEIQTPGWDGILTTEDFTSYRPTLHPPLISRHIQGHTIVGVPPPSSGGAAIIGAIRFLSHFTLPLASTMQTLSMHRIVEACKHVFAMRMLLSDPDYNSDVVSAVVYDLINGTYMDELRRFHYRDDTTLSLSHYGGPKWALLWNNTDIIDTSNVQQQRPNITDAQEGDRKYRQQQQRGEDEDDTYPSRDRNLQRSFGYLNDHGTSHFSVVDRYGNAVSMTTSINTNFGSHIRSPTTGIIYSNTMDDFSKPDVPNHYGVQPSESNYIQPGKRPLSSMSPTMVFREDTSYGDGDHSSHSSIDDDDDTYFGKLVLVIGASGGPKIITSVLQVLLRTIWMGQELWDAVTYPRIHDQLIYHGVAITATEHATVTPHISTNTNHRSNSSSDPVWTISVSNRTRDALTMRKHELLNIDFSGTVQAIAIDYDNIQNLPLYTAVSDPRKGGSPAGY